MLANFDGFESIQLPVDAGNETVTINAKFGGDGPGLLLLHGFPQTHFMWRRLAGELIEAYTVVAADLRGYGDSSQATDKPDHSSYSFRAMAADQVKVMASLGFDRFTVIGHDRGARVAHRMATDEPSVVERLVLLDILPTSYMYSHLERQVATAYYHWLFFIQPYDLPERMIGADPIYYLHSLLGRWGTASSAHQPEALSEYERCFANASVRHAMMEDYRAGASIDLEHDDEGSLIAAPTLVLWGERGVVARAEGGPLKVWQDKTDDPQKVVGSPIPAAGHFLIEEAYEHTRDRIVEFLRAGHPNSTAVRLG